MFLDRLISTLSFGFAMLATILAAIGLYGVLAYTVAQRTREFGLAVAIGVGQLAKSMLFEMEGYDPLVITLATIALAVVSLGAGFLPALRASQIDPMNALRYE